MEKIRILLADDHPIVREGTRRVVEQEADFEVVGEAGDGEEAVKLAKELSPDVALIDIMMPKLNGVEATRQIKEACPNIAVLVLSAYDDDQFVFNLLEAGAAGYLLKSMRGQEMVTAIRAVWEGESVLHPSVFRKVLKRSVSDANKVRPKEKPQDLSEREIEVLRLATRGLNNQEIATELHLSLRTIQFHFTQIARKLKVGSSTEAMLRGLKEGWLSLNESSPSGD